MITKVKRKFNVSSSTQRAGSGSTQAHERPIPQGLPGMKTLMGILGTHLSHTPCMGDFQCLLLTPEHDRNRTYRGEEPSPTVVQEPRQPHSEDSDSAHQSMHQNPTAPPKTVGFITDSN